MKGCNHPWGNSILQMAEGSDFHQGWRHGREEYFSRLDAGMIEHTIRLLDEELLALICRNNGTRWYFTLDAQDDAAAHVGYLVGYLSGPLMPETEEERTQRRADEFHENTEGAVTPMLTNIPPEQDETGQLTRMLPHGTGAIRIFEPLSTRAAIYARDQHELDACISYCEQRHYTLLEQHRYQGTHTLMEDAAMRPLRRAAYQREFDVLVVYEEQCISTNHRYLSAFKTAMQVNHIRIEQVRETEPDKAIQEPSFD